MRRRVTLYIGDTAVDLDDSSYILFNFTQEDLDNPTVVRNSYTQQVTLQGTDTNNAVFGHCFRLDRRVMGLEGDTGAAFNPLRKTPFTIYDECNNILQSGYVKLDSVTRRGRWIVSYQVTLYGGLGSYLYNLSYDDEGNQRTLAGLDYLGTGDSATELDFTIDADTVQAAWNVAADGGDVDGIWKVINFAPCYNGIPDSDFSADKALGKPSDFGLADSLQDGDAQYGLRNGYALFNLANEVDEWAVKDLRSYLQRPVLAMRAFFKAIADPANNGGYTVDISRLTDQSSFNYARTWMTLPMLSSLTANDLGDIDLHADSEPGFSTIRAEYQIGLFPTGTRMDISVNMIIRAAFSGVTNEDLYTYTETLVDVTEDYTETDTYTSVLFVQLVAYDAESNPVGASQVKGVFRYTGAYDLPTVTTPEGMAGQVGYLPVYDLGTETFEPAATAIPFVSRNELGTYDYPELSFSIKDTYNAQYAVIYIRSYTFVTNLKVFKDGTNFVSFRHTGGENSLPTLYKQTYSSNGVTDTIADSVVISDSSNGSVAEITASQIRSGAKITKAMLLSTEHTPADYLLSFCKVFGFVMLYDSPTKKITIMQRSQMYGQNIGIVDLSGRVDVSQDITVEPYSFTAKWYDFELEGSGGKFEEQYSSLYGRSYGMQRVNTGYEFDAENNAVLEDNALRSAAAVLQNSRYMNIIHRSGGVYQPSPFVDKGNTYTLWDADGNTLDTDISCPPLDSTVEYYNTRKGYDIQLAAKAQLYGEDGNAVEGQGVLLMRNGSAVYPYFRLSDDVSAMDLLNDGKPCWMLSPGNPSGIRIPIYSRYIYDTSIVSSLDMGKPAEIAIPGVQYPDGVTVYDRQWKRYLSDRYNVNSKVLRCRVNLTGLQVGQEMLGRFYYYAGSIWVLNSISNHSLTTWDLTECEFIQVQDTAAYIDGNAVINVEPSVLVIPAEGGSASFTVTSNDDFNIE